MKIKHLASAAILALGLFSCTAEKEQISGISLENMDLNSAPGTDFFEYACGVSGYILGVNPFDQPGVELGKKLSRQAEKQFD